LEMQVIGESTPAGAAAIITALLGGQSGVLIALMLPTLVNNKVDAFAVMKLISVVGLVPVVAYFVPEPWQFAFGWVPVYWPCKIWWATVDDQTWLLYVVPGVAKNALWIAWFARRS